MSDDKQKVMDVGRVSVWTLSPGAAFFYMGGMAIDADGAPTAYHPNGTSGLDALGNAGRRPILAAPWRRCRPYLLRRVPALRQREAALTGGHRRAGRAPVQRMGRDAST